jgi:hypothetical protein
MLVVGLEEEAKRVPLLVSAAGLRRCLVEGRNSVHLPLVLGAHDTPELFRDTLRMVFVLNKENKTLKDEGDGEI